MKVIRTYNIIQCDFCDNDQENTFMHTCDICGADMCQYHTYTIRKLSDDGCLCKLCPTCLNNTNLTIFKKRNK